MNFVLPVVSSKKLILLLFVFLSLLLAAYSPMVAVGHAQSAADLQKLKDLKQKEIDELTRRIDSLEKTQKSLDVTINIDKDGKNKASLSADGSGLDGYVELPSATKAKIKEFNQKIIDELKQLRTEAQKTTSLQDAQVIAKNVDAQAPLSFMGNVQGAVTSAIESLTGALDKVKSTAGDLQGQVTKIKDCTSGTSSGTSTGCDELNTASAETATAAQGQLDSISTVTSTITSVLMSAIALLTTLLTTFTSMSGGLGSLGSLGNIGSLSSLTSLGDLSSLTSLTSSLGSFSSLLGPFTSILSQLDIGNLMSGNALGSLSSLTSLINI
jgi:cell division protein FtsB